jgi:hypothetical protein
MNNNSLSAAQRLMQIKSGAKKSEMNHYVNAASKNTATFQPIPVGKPKGGPQQSVKPENRVEVESFQAQGSNEAKSIEAMFDDSPSYSMPTTNVGFQQMQQIPMDGNLNIDSVMNSTPTFNPSLAIEKAKQRQHNNQFLKFAQNNPEAQSAMQMINAAENPEVYSQMAVQHQQPQLQPQGFSPELLEVIKVVSKAMAEETLNKVLNEFTHQQQQQQKGRLTFEYYNKDKTIIKTSEGRFYKLTALEIVEEGGKKKFRTVG